LIDAVRGKLYASYDTATEAFLALTDHATSGAETVSASQLVEHLIACVWRIALSPHQPSFSHSRAPFESAPCVPARASRP